MGSKFYLVPAWDWEAKSSEVSGDLGMMSEERRKPIQAPGAQPKVHARFEGKSTRRIAAAYKDWEEPP